LLLEPLASEPQTQILMFSSFEIKNYNQLQFALGLTNTVLAGSLLLGVYFYALLPDHAQAVDATIKKLASNKILVSLPILMVVSGVWGWLSTVLLRIHDRWHEPWIRKWRAGYEADFILRGLCYDGARFISRDLFERAYDDKRVRSKVIQRLFYNFIGDEAKLADGRRLFFYACMWKYWTLSLVEIYLTLFLFITLVYRYSAGGALAAPWLILLIAFAGAFLARVLQNLSIDEAHKITIEQMDIIRREKAKDFEKAAKDVAKELNALAKP
jgi:hypothetical protein